MGLQVDDLNFWNGLIKKYDFVGVHHFHGNVSSQEVDFVLNPLSICTDMHKSVYVIMFWYFFYELTLKYIGSFVGPAKRIYSIELRIKLQSLFFLLEHSDLNYRISHRISCKH